MLGQDSGLYFRIGIFNVTECATVVASSFYSKNYLNILLYSTMESQYRPVAGENRSGSHYPLPFP